MGTPRPSTRAGAGRRILPLRGRAEARPDSVTLPHHTAAAWMCLERCGATAQDIADQLHQLDVNRTSFTDVAFELYNLGDNSSLVVNNLTKVGVGLLAPPT